MKKTYYDLKIYDNGMMLGCCKRRSRHCRFSTTGKRWVPQGIYIDESGKEHRLVYLHDREKFYRLFAREQELLKRAPAGSDNERSKP